MSNKSFVDDIFNNKLNIESINGLNISKEAIEENKEHNKIDDIKKQLKEYNIDEYKEQVKEEKKKKKVDPKQEYEELLQEQERLEEKEQEQEKMTKYKKQDDENNDQKKKEPYTKRTMIFKDEYLDIINGLANVTHTEVKGTFNKVLELGIDAMAKMYGKELIEKAIKNSKKAKDKKSKEFNY